MYLSNEETSLLTDAVKYFEVGFRSYIAETILNKYNTIDSYRDTVYKYKRNYILCEYFARIRQILSRR